MFFRVLLVSFGLFRPGVARAPLFIIIRALLISLYSKLKLLLSLERYSS